MPPCGNVFNLFVIFNGWLIYNCFWFIKATFSSLAIFFSVYPEIITAIFLVSSLSCISNISVDKWNINPLIPGGNKKAAHT